MGLVERIGYNIGMSDIQTYEEQRPWGLFRQFVKNSPCTVKIITVNAGEAFRLQSHKNRTEFWHVLKGDGVMEIGDNKYDTKEGDEHLVEIGEKHRITGGQSGIDILEIATGDFDESDIIRFEDKYGRA